MIADSKFSKRKCPRLNDVWPSVGTGVCYELGVGLILYDQTTKTRLQIDLSAEEALDIADLLITAADRVNKSIENTC